jgi:uncharacterized protein YcfJ
VKTKLIVGAAVALFATFASAQEIVQTGYARVVGVEPITNVGYRTVPRTSCTTIQRQSSSGPVVGAIVGGAVGHNMAKDKAAGTAVGAVAGAIIGDHVTQMPKDECVTYHDREYYNRITGYNVTFEYDGELRTVRLARDPGARISVKVVKRVYVLE